MNASIQKRKKPVALLLTLILCMTVSVGAADPENTTGRFPDEKLDGSAKITIHKLDLGSLDPDKLNRIGDGQEITDNPYIDEDDTVNLDSLGKLKDIEFLAEFHKFNPATSLYEPVTTSSGWGSTPTGVTWKSTTFSDYTVNGYAGTTDANGKLLFNNLPFGKYVIYEMDSQGYIGVNDPFTVYVPTELTTSRLDGQTQWIYDIHVYPKNTSAGKFEKQLLRPDDTEGVPAVGDDAHGNRFSWQFELELKTLADKEWIEIVDTLDSRLSLNVNDIKVEYVTAASPTTRVPLLDSLYSKTVVGQVMTVRLVADIDSRDPNTNGLDHLVQESATTLYVTLTTFTDANADTSSTGVLTNTGTYNWKNQGQNPGTTDPPEEEKPFVTNGDLEIAKKGDDGEELDGVKFILFKNESAANAYLTGSSPTVLSDMNCVVADLGKTPGTEDRYTFATTGGGILNIRNIESSYSATTTQSTPDVIYKYWLVETYTLNNYNLLPGPVLVDFASIDGTGKIELEVINSAGFTLPHTGGSGTIAFTVIGLSLITIAGVAFAIYYRRKKHGNPTA